MNKARCPTDALLESQIGSEFTYEDVLLSAWRYQLKNYVDWFLVQYRKLLESYCRKASHNRSDAWEDLLSECFIEAYAAAQRYDPSKGVPLLQFLLVTLKMFPHREDHWRKYGTSIPLYTDNSSDNDEQLNIKYLQESSYTEDFSANEGPPNVYKIIESLDENEKTLIHFKLLGMSNVQIAKMSGRAESTIRLRLETALGKLRVKGDGR
jgi:RNA polymerase sigma factor (sigma-70 family)